MYIIYLQIEMLFSLKNIHYIFTYYTFSLLIRYIASEAEAALIFAKICIMITFSLNISSHNCQ